MAETTTPALSSNRLMSLDAYRGFVMFLMAAELLEIPRIAAHFPGSHVWQFLKEQSSHVAWTGCSLHDLIQPSFSFMVGVALPFSMASRLARGQSKLHMTLHAVWRALLLVLLGVFLRSIGKPITNWTFEDTLSQIGLGYPFLFLLGFAGSKTRWASLVIILVGYWAAFACFRLPPTDFNDAAVNVPNDWSDHFDGFAAHWNINHNAAWSFDTWFMNLFPRKAPFTGNLGGYCTLSFIPTLGTMLLGLIAGTWLKQGNDDDAAEKVTTKLLITGLVCLALGWLLHVTAICPVVKKIWTPSWTLFSGGWCFFIMAAFYHVMDVCGWKRGAFPLVVIGMNSIAMYVMVHTITGFIGDSLHTHFGRSPFLILGETYEPMAFGGCVLLILWLILLWMHRRKIYLRI